MKVAITGGCGHIGLSLAQRLLEKGEMIGPNGMEEIERVSLIDIAKPKKLPSELSESVDVVLSDICELSMDTQFPKTDVVFHLSSVLSGESELDFNKAMRVNLDGTRGLLEALRAGKSPTRVVFSSTIAVFGILPEQGQAVGDSTKQAPMTTYGTTKAIGERLINEYSRKGFVDGRSARLPTVIVRNGKPSMAASSFCSDIVREPLNGIDAVLPVPREQPMPLTGYKSVVDGMIALCELDASALEGDLAVGLPALNVTAGDIADVVGKLREKREGMGKVTEQINPAIASICASWPSEIDNTRASKLGLPKPSGLDEIVDDFINNHVDV